MPEKKSFLKGSSNCGVFLSVGEVQANVLSNVLSFMRKHITLTAYSFNWGYCLRKGLCGEGSGIRAMSDGDAFGKNYREKKHTKQYPSQPCIPPSATPWDFSSNLNDQCIIVFFVICLWIWELQNNIGCKGSLGAIWSNQPPRSRRELKASFEVGLI